MSDDAHPRGGLIHELISAAAAAAPDRPAVIVPNGPRVGFAEFDHRVRATAAWVSARTRRGDRVAVIADNGLDYARLYYGVPRAGRVLTMINQRLGAAEQRAQVALVEPAALVADPRYLAGVSNTGVEHIVGIDDPRWLDNGATRRRLDREPAVDPDDPAWLLFTSGSTGTPKGVVHTHRSILAAVRGTIAGRSVTPGGVYLLPFPMCHIAGYNMLVHHATCSTVVLMAAFRPAEFVAVVNAYGVTSCSLAPTMLHALLAHVEQTGAAMPTLTDIAYGSAPMPADLLRRAIDRLEVGFHQGYGMTETGGNITFLGPDEHRAGVGGDPFILATAGRPHSGVRIRIGDGGEILVRGTQVAAQIWPQTPATTDGWLHTGDVGRLDADGRLVVTDRIKDVIISGGENVSSREVEDTLSGHPGVDQVAVVGVPDEYWGEAICAVVVPRAEARPSGADLVAHVRAHLSAFKRPRHVLFVEALPMTLNGKIAKDAVRRYAVRHYRGPDHETPPPADQVRPGRQ